MSKEYNLWNGAARRTEDITLRTEAGNWPCDCSQQLKENSPFCFEAGKKCRFCLFLLCSYYPRGFPAPPQPQSAAPSSEFQVIYCQCPKADRSGAKESSSPCTESSPGGSQIWWFFRLPFPRGRLRRGCKNLGARSLACQEANCLHILQEQHPCLGKGRKRQNK